MLIIAKKKLKYNTISLIETIPGDFSNPVKLEYYSENLENRVANFIKSQNLEKADFNLSEQSTKFSNWKHLDKIAIIPLLSTFDINPKQIKNDLVGCKFCEFKNICYMYISSIFIAGFIYLINTNIIPDIDSYILKVIILILLAPIITIIYLKILSLKRTARLQ